MPVPTVSKLTHWVHSWLILKMILFCAQLTSLWMEPTSESLQAWRKATIAFLDAFSEAVLIILLVTTWMLKHPCSTRSPMLRSWVPSNVFLGLFSHSPFTITIQWSIKPHIEIVGLYTITSFEDPDLCLTYDTSSNIIVDGISQYWNLDVRGSQFV